LTLTGTGVGLAVLAPLVTWLRGTLRPELWLVVPALFVVYALALGIGYGNDHILKQGGPGEGLRLIWAALPESVSRFLNWYHWFIDGIVLMFLRCLDSFWEPRYF